MTKTKHELALSLVVRPDFAESVDLRSDSGDGERFPSWAIVRERQPEMAPAERTLLSSPSGKSRFTNVPT